jgi:filamentous hemagglutinin family protein
LGAEASRVNPGVNIGGQPGDRIEGGARRGVNLFHSFLDFNVNLGQRVYFANPTGVDNILTRVTGTSVSNILGTLGVEGTANLFLLNPNGILFGPNAQLDVRGSFVASTGDRFVFPNGETFDATNPQVPSLLTINVPIGLQYGRTPGSIVVRETSLQVDPGKSLALVGGDVQLQDSELIAPGGRIELGAAIDSFVELNLSDNLFQFNFPSAARRANISINGTLLDTSSFEGNGGNININANFLSMQNTLLFSDAFELGNSGSIIINAVTNSNLDSVIISSTGGYEAGRGGDIQITTGNLSITNDSLLTSETFGDGDAGNIIINTINSSYLSGVEINSSSGIGKGRGGNIEINTDSLSVTGRTRLDTSLYGEGSSGNIILNARNDILLINGEISTQVRTGSKGDGGDIRVAANNLFMQQSLLQTPTSGQGNAGSVIINTNNNVTLDRSRISSDVTNQAIGNGGDIRITASSLFLLNNSPNLGDQSSLGTGTSGVGNAGNIIINARDAVVFERSPIFSSVGDTAIGNGGNIEITAGSFAATSSGLITGVGDRGRGNAGNVVLKVRDSTSLKGGGIYTNIGNLEGLSTGGNVEITTGSLYVLSGAQLFASTEGKGNAGNVTIRAQDFVVIDGVETRFLGNDFDDRRSSSIFSSAESRATGRGGTIAITSPSFLITNSGVINAQTKNSQQGGDISITANNFEARNGGQIITTTSNSGQAGNINLNVADALTLDGINQNYAEQQLSIREDRRGDTQGAASGLYANAVTNSTGQSGNIQIKTGSFLLNAGAQIVTSTDGQGNAGNINLDAENITIARGGKILAATDGRGDGGTIIINASKAVNLGIGVQDFSPVISVETSGAGKAGDIVVRSPSLALSDTARITATATSTSTNISGGGSITLNASSMDLAGIVGIFAETQGITPAGTLRLNPYNAQLDLGINLAPSSRISASTSGSGNGGDLILTAPRSITLAGPGQLAVETSSTGNAGNINVATQQLTMRDGVELSASTSSSGKAGDINIAASSVALSGGARVATNTAGSGQAGNLNLQVRDQLGLAGAGTGLFASTTPGSSGNGGSITIDPRTVLIQDGATIAVNSQGQGQGGNIAVQAGRLELRDRGSITAETASTQGGNITLNVQDLLLLRRNSLISTTAGTAQAGGNGGNIRISAPFVIGVLSENSDIRANAFTGQGGRVDITAQGIFGLKFQPRDTPRSDITASSQFGVSGQVVLNILGIDPSQGLTELPTNLTDPSNQINQVCANRNSANGKANEFVVTGRGGLPPNPTTPLTGDELMAGWVSMPREAAPNPATVASQPAPPSAIVEAQGWVVDAAGNVTLVAHTETGLTRLNSVIPQNCR